jgi:hypothetical protein
MLFDEVVFTVEGESYRWRDVVFAAVRRGEWRAIARRVREGMACQRATEGSANALPAGVLDAAGREFRYARDLVTALSMEEWLTRWGITARDWTSYLRRAALRELFATELREMVKSHPVSDEDIAPHLMAEAICSGELERIARDLAGRAAGAAAAPEDDSSATNGNGSRPTTRVFVGSHEEAANVLNVDFADVMDLTARFDRLEARFSRFRLASVSDRAVHDWLSGRKLDWVRFDCRVMAFANREMASEAAAMLRDDGEGFTSVYVAAHAEPREELFFLDQMDPAIRDHFLSARAGDLVGPVRVNGEYALYLVREKILPSAHDPEVRRRAEEGVLHHALEQQLSHRVQWLAPN